jgi:hypothetical protein
LASMVDCSVLMVLVRAASTVLRSLLLSPIVSVRCGVGGAEGGQLQQGRPET